MRNTYFLALLSASLIFLSCTKVDHEMNKAPDRDHKLKIQRIIDDTRSYKTINPFDEIGTFAFNSTGQSESGPSLKYGLADDHKFGSGAFELNYEFTGVNSDDETETVYIEQVDQDWRSDLSFEPLALSIWIKGHKGNKGIFRFVIMEDEKIFIAGKPHDPSRKRWQYYAFEDKDILSKEGWHRLVMPYDEFFVYKQGNGIKSESPTLNRYAGFRIEISNTESTPSQGKICIDELRQLTSFELKPNNAKFSSMFLQLNYPYYNDTDWDQEFMDSKAIGIDTWIIQYVEQYSSDGVTVSFYENTNLPWIKTKCDYLDRMFAAAERQGMKLILGLYPGIYGSDTSDPGVYSDNLKKDKQVFDEVYSLYGNHPCLAGWYITEEFHDGAWPLGGWQQEPASILLADYLQKIASYVKSKSSKSVLIAPALWRGMPADICGKWFEKLFKQTPSIDFLYLQDCGGRNSGSYYLTDVDVDLPNWYAEIKKSCEKTGVKFGVDIESFKIDYKSKTWDEIHDQLWVAGMFTEYITNFSWNTFKKGTPGYEGYKNYLNDNGLLDATK